MNDPKKEQVQVFSKTTARGFSTAIKNIMAERRFHEFRFDKEYLARFEEGVSRIEDMLLPTYRLVVERGALSNDPDERATLAVLIAFQMLRTRSYRDMYVRLEKELGEHLAESGHTLSDLAGYQPQTEDMLKAQQIKAITEQIGTFASAICEKDFVLLRAPKGRGFYLSDNPVALHNDAPRHPLFGNLGLAVRGIQIHLPLSAELMLCAWCPSILAELRAGLAKQRRLVSSTILSPKAMAQIDTDLLDKLIRDTNGHQTSAKRIFGCFDDGHPLSLEPINMDFYNTMQVHNAREFIVCQRGDFELARRFLAARQAEGVGRKLTTLA